MNPAISAMAYSGEPNSLAHTRTLYYLIVIFRCRLRTRHPHGRSWSDACVPENYSTARSKSCEIQRPLIQTNFSQKPQTTAPKISLLLLAGRWERKYNWPIILGPDIVQASDGGTFGIFSYLTEYKIGQSNDYHSSILSWRWSQIEMCPFSSVPLSYMFEMCSQIYVRAKK